MRPKPFEEEINEEEDEDENSIKVKII